MTTLDDGELGYVSDRGVANEVAALLHGLTVVTRTGPEVLPADASTALVIDDRPAEDKAAEVCWQLLNLGSGQLRGEPIEVDHHGTRTPSPFLYADCTTPARRAWFVRITLAGEHACLQALTTPAGGDWEKAGPPVWLGYPTVWDEHSTRGFRAELINTVLDLFGRLAAHRKDQDDVHGAGQLPGTRP